MDSSVNDDASFQSNDLVESSSPDYKDNQEFSTRHGLSLTNEDFLNGSPQVMESPDVSVSDLTSGFSAPSYVQSPMEEISQGQADTAGIIDNGESSSSQEGNVHAWFRVSSLSCGVAGHDG